MYFRFTWSMKTTSSMDPTDMVKEIKKVLIYYFDFLTFFVFLFFKIFILIIFYLFFRYLKTTIAIMSKESSSCYFVFTVMAGKII